MCIDMLLDNDNGLTLIAALAGALWTFFKTTRFFSELKRQRVKDALKLLEAGVEATYREYVQGLKAGRADGKLTEEERAEARQRAINKAIAFGRMQGLDVIRALGSPCLDLWIAKLVKRLKHA